MTHHTQSLAGKTALVTGAAHRLGNAISRALHAAGMNIVCHYRSSRAGAEALQQELEGSRGASVALLQADLHRTHELPGLVETAAAAFGGLDVLINNASSFYPTALGRVEEAQWEDLLGTNLKAPFFLTQAAHPHLRRGLGAVVNLVDIHADRPLRGHPVYSIAKAGLVMMTKAMAAEMGPEVRVNAVAPGAILWPEQDMDQTDKDNIIERTFLKRRGDPGDIAGAVLYLVRDAVYVSGHVLTVDGGRSQFG